MVLPPTFLKSRRENTQKRTRREKPSMRYITGKTEKRSPDYITGKVTSTLGFLPTKSFKILEDNVSIRQLVIAECVHYTWILF